MPASYRGVPLKPCPFCGERNELYVGKYEDPHVRCGRCNGTAYGMPVDNRGTGPASIMGAVRRWNTRPSPRRRE